MNRQEIENKIQTMERELEELKEELKQKESLTPPRRRWRAEKNDEYYYITERGFATFKTEIGSGLDDARYELGNYFETREQAEFEAERLKVIAELREYATSVDEFDWNNSHEYKYMLDFETKDINSFLTVDYWHKCQLSDLCFESEKVAKAAIEAVGEDRIIKYYFRRGENNVDSD